MQNYISPGSIKTGSKNENKIIFGFNSWFSFCGFTPDREEPLPENPYRRALLEKLREKIECEECRPTKEELIQYYLLKMNLNFRKTG